MAEEDYEYKELQPVQAGTLFRRVGVNQRKRLAWALGFAQQELETLPSGDLENLRQELCIFGFMGVWRDLEESQRQTNFVENIQALDLSNSIDIQVIRDKDLYDTQVKIKKVLSDLGTHAGPVEVGPFSFYHVVDIEADPIADRAFRELFLTRVLPLGPDPQLFHSQKIEGEQSDFLFFVFSSLLSRYAALVRRCPDLACKKWFIAGRKNQHYCGTQCQVRSATRKFRKDHDTKKKTNQKRQAKKTISKRRGK